MKRVVVLPGTGCILGGLIVLRKDMCMWWHRPFEKVKCMVPLEQKSLNIDFPLDLYLTGNCFSWQEYSLQFANNFLVTGNPNHTLYLKRWCQLKTIVMELIFLVCFTVNRLVCHRLVVKLVPNYLQQETGDGMNKYWKKVKWGWGKPINFCGSMGIFWEQTTNLFPFIFNPCLHVKQNNVHCYGEGFGTGTSTNTIDMVEDFSKVLCSPVLMMKLFSLFAETRVLKTFPRKRQLGPG